MQRTIIERGTVELAFVDDLKAFIVNHEILVEDMSEAGILELEQQLITSQNAIVRMNL